MYYTYFQITALIAFESECYVQFITVSFSDSQCYIHVVITWAQKVFNGIENSYHKHQEGSFAIFRYIIRREQLKHAVTAGKIYGEPQEDIQQRFLTAC